MIFGISSRKIKIALDLTLIRYQIGTFSRSYSHKFPIRRTPLEVLKNARCLTIHSSCKVGNAGND